MRFEVKDVSCGYPGGARVLENVNFEVSSGEVLCILGANGAGKSTLFKSILGLIRLQDGTIRMDGEDIAGWSRAKVARTIGYIPQSTNPPFSYSVLDIILMGRTAYLGMFASPRGEDLRVADEVIACLGIERLMDRRYLQLSGGEKQLVLIARALAQQPRLLIMDEPTAALDFGNQQMILSQIGQLSAQGLAIVMASHFPDHAFLYSSHVLLLKDHGIYARGAPGDVVTERRLKELYNVDTRIVDTGICADVTGKGIKVCVPVSRGGGR